MQYGDSSFRIVLKSVFDQWLPGIDKKSGIGSIPVRDTGSQALKNVILGPEDSMSSGNWYKGSAGVLSYLYLPRCHACGSDRA